MNYINALISINSEDSSIAERMEGKKTLFGFGNELEIHKLVYGFFMDAYKANFQERPAYEGLSKYEFFAGSLTCHRLCKEINAFLNSPSSSRLDNETKTQLRAFVKLLEESQELSHLIDLHRSSHLRCLFLAATGKGSSVADTTIELEPEHLQALSSSALKKVNALEPGQHALFLTGTVLHETLLCVERMDNGTFSVRSYDPASGSRSFITDEEILKEPFWNELYTLKFSKGSKNTSVNNQLDRFGKEDFDERHSESRLRPQRKNTCHFRCFLAFLKDQMIRKSPLALQDAYEQWHLFKVSFGQFLLESEHLRNEPLIDLSKKQQERRVKRQEKADHFSLCIQKGMFEETFALYETLIDKLGAWFGERKSPQHFYTNPLKTLLCAEKMLLETLEACPVSPKDVSPLFKNAQNPWIERSFAHFEEAWRKKEAHFQNSLKEELETASEWNRTLEPLKRYAYALLRTVSFDLFQMGSNYQPVPKVAGNEQQVQELLDLFESTPEMLHFIEGKPCFFAILLQAIQLGKIEQLERIYQKLPAEDQGEILRYCDQQLHILFPPALPDTLKDYVHQHPKSPFIDILVGYLCLKAWNNGQFLDYFRMSYIRPDSFILKTALMMREIPEDKIVECLAGLDSFSKEIGRGDHPFTKEILYRAQNSLFEPENGCLRDAVRNFTIPGLKERLEKGDMYS